MHHDGGYAPHHHSHSLSAQDTPTTFAYLNYLLEHNTHHAEELHQLAHQLDALGFPGAAAAVHAAREHYEAGNAELVRALTDAPTEALHVALEAAAAAASDAADAPIEASEAATAAASDADKEE